MHYKQSDTCHSPKWFTTPLRSRGFRQYNLIQINPSWICSPDPKTNSELLLFFSSRKQELLKYFSIFFFLLPTFIKYCQYVIYTIIINYFSDYFRFFFFPFFLIFSKNFFRHFYSFLHFFHHFLTFENFFYYSIFFHYYFYASTGLTFKSCYCLSNFLVGQLEVVTIYSVIIAPITITHLSNHSRFFATTYVCT